MIKLTQLHVGLASFISYLALYCAFCVPCSNVKQQAVRFNNAVTTSTCISKS